ncbi:MAG: MarC family protein [Kiritimatiellia bacterium]|nr:MarC family protein [Kiritimatiellia bacterium]
MRDKTKEAMKLTEQPGVVPLGTPLIIGPGAITTLLVHNRPEASFWNCLPGLWPVLTALARQSGGYGALSFFHRPADAGYRPVGCEGGF